MKQLLHTLFVLLVGAALLLGAPGEASAQSELDIALPESPAHLLLYGHIGSGVNENGQMRNLMRQSLGSLISYNRAELNLGGRLWVGFGQGIMIGGGGYGKTLAIANSPIGEGDLHGGFGFFNLGLSAWHNHNTNVITFAGVGGGVHRLNLKNTSQFDISNTATELNGFAAGEDRTYRLPGPAVEVGISVQRYFWGSGKGGFALGAELGGQWFSGQQWLDEGGNDLNNLEAYNQFSGYLRLTLGLATKRSSYHQAHHSQPDSALPNRDPDLRTH